MKIEVAPGQTLSDIAVQWLGSEEGVYSLAELNGLSVTADLTAGQVLELPAVVDKRGRAVMAAGQYVPAASPQGAEEVNIAPLLPSLPPEVGQRGVVAPGQTLTDIAVQWLGSEEGLYSLAELNGLSVTATVEAGQLLRLPAVVDITAASRLEAGSWQPAAGTEEILEGIEIWAIELDFIVS